MTGTVYIYISAHVNTFAIFVPSYCDTVVNNANT